MNHNLMQKTLKFNDVAIVSIKGSHYRTHFCYLSKNDAINIMKNSDFMKEVDYYKLFSLI